MTSTPSMRCREPRRPPPSLSLGVVDMAMPRVIPKPETTMPKSKSSPLAKGLEALIESHSMPEVVAELIRYSRRHGGNGWAPWESALTTALSDAAGPDEVAELVGKPTRKPRKK